MSNSMWEILVPKCWPNGKDIPYLYHKVWDNEVSKLAGGLSVFRSINGVWVDKENGQVVSEKMIPVKIMCDQDTMRDIAQWTAGYYRQKSVLYYKVTDEVHEYVNPAYDPPKKSTPIFQPSYREPDPTIDPRDYIY